MEDVGPQLSPYEKALYEGEGAADPMETDDDDLSKGETTSTGGRSKYMSMDFAGSVFLITSEGRMLNLPIPSESPLDPLNWVLARRMLVLAILNAFLIVALFLIQTPANLRAAFLLEFDQEDMAPFTVDALAASPTLLMGVSFFLWIPLSVAFGRRPIIFLASVVLTLGTLGAGFAPNFHSLLAAICFIGLGVGASLSVTLLQIIDITFIHERPLAIAAYWGTASFISLQLLAALPSIPEISTQWRPIFKVASLPAAAVSVALFFFVPETHFNRPPIAFDGRVLVQSSTEKVKVYDEWHDVPLAQGNTTMAAIEDSLPPRLEDMPRHTWRVTPLTLWRRSIADPRAAAISLMQIFACVANPLVFWVALYNAVNFGAMMAVGTGFPVVMSLPPYNLPPKAVGLVNISAGFGSLSAFPATYFLAHSVMKKLTRRNGGVRLAEYYLPAFVLPVVTGAVSVFLYGFAASNSWSPVAYHISYALNSFSFTSGGITNTLWVTESLPQWAAPGLAVVGGVSYMSSWGITAALPAWEAAWGVEWVCIGLGVAVLLVGMLAVPLAFWGESVRQFISGRWGDCEAGALRPQPRPGKGEKKLKSPESVLDRKSSVRTSVTWI